MMKVYPKMRKLIKMMTSFIKEQKFECYFTDNITYSV